MTDDRWPDIDLDFSDDTDRYFAVPRNHPAFRQPEDDDPDNLNDGLNDPITPPIVQLPVGRYDGFNGQDDQDAIGVLNHNDPRQRESDARFIAERLERAGERIAQRAIGQRNAIAHSRSTGEGEGSGAEVPPSPLESALAESLEQAGVRFRDELKSSGDNPVVIPRNKRGIIKTPTFEKANVWGQLSALKSNTAGDWMVTLRIDADCDEEVTKLAKAHGLNLEVAIRRKPRDE
jgi:hypothetical protein